METIERKTAYGPSQKKYYEAHKAEILQKSKESGAYERKYKSAYQRNKETIKAKALARYYAKKALNTPVPEPLSETPDLLVLQ
jgi:hypothetical protein